MLSDSAAPDLVRVANVRAISDGPVLMCEMADGHRIGIPLRFIAASSEVRKPGDVGMLVIKGLLARNLGLAVDRLR